MIKVAKKNKPQDDQNDYVTCPRCGDLVMTDSSGNPRWHFKPGKFVECK